MPVSLRTRMGEVSLRLEALERTIPLGVRVEEVAGIGRRIVVGGQWWPAVRAYTGPIDNSLILRSFFASRQQYDVIRDAIAALACEPGAPRDILIHGGRRAGKSSAVAPIVALCAVMRPRSETLIIGPRVAHGRRIQQWIRSVLPPETHDWDPRTNTLRIINGSVIHARASDDYDREIGAALDLLVIDEAATLPRAVYDRLAPGTYDRRGLVVLSTTPRGHNWVYDVYRTSQKSVGTTRSYRLSFFDNPFVDARAKQDARDRAEVVSSAAYREDVEGEFLPQPDAAFPEWSDDKNVRDIKELGDNDMTTIAAKQIWDRDGVEWIVGVDFNAAPTIGAICKIARDGSWWVAREVSVDGSAIETWGLLLHRALRDLGCDDPQAQAVVVADATGLWQGVHTRGRVDPPTWDVLRAQGWHLDSPTGITGKNPPRAHRLDVARSLVCSGRGRRRFFADPSCSAVIAAMRGLRVRDGKPAPRDPHTHAYDAATYGAYRVHGTGDGDLIFGRVVSYRDPHEEDENAE